MWAFSVYWVGKFKNGSKKCERTLSFHAATTADITETVDAFVSAMNSKGWALDESHMRATEVRCS